MKVVEQVSAGGIVFKEVKNEKLKMKNVLWLICQHSQHKGWVFPKGFVGDVDKGESNETAALREVLEEGGVKAKIVKPEPIVSHYQYEFEGVLYQKTVYYFLMEYISGDPKNHDWEMMDGKFVPEDEVKKTLTYPSDIEAFTEALQGL
jgi:diadenosine hexaphosphate hydrolase (ATP-forming)